MRQHVATQIGMKAPSSHHGCLQGSTGEFGLYSKTTCVMFCTDPIKCEKNCIDFYQATPTRYDPQLRNDIRPDQLSKEPKVPVIRVFGSTQTGQKVCAHIHGAFPYMYIEYTGSLAPEEGELTCTISSLSGPWLNSDISWRIHLSAPSFHRPCLGCELPPGCLQPQSQICRPHHSRQRGAFLRLPYWLSVLPQDLHVQPRRHDQTRRSASPRSHYEAQIPAI